jgi:hypothetical protein
MTSDTHLDEAIERTLAAAAAAPPVPHMSFVEEVGRRRQARRRRRTVLSAMALVVVVAVPVTVLTMARRDGAPPAASALDARPIQQVYATERLPAVLPGGRPYAVAGRTGPDTYVVLPRDTAPQSLPMLWTVGQPAPRPIGSLANTARLTGYRFGGQVVVGTKLIVWTMYGSDRGIDRDEVWAADLDGGNARRWSAFGRSAGEPVAVYPVGSAVYATAPPVQGEVWTYRIDVPGDLKVVKGSFGYTWRGGTVLARPAGSPGRVTIVDPADGEPVTNAGQEDYWDLATGERWTMAPRPDWTHGRCGPRWCVSRHGSELTGYQPDGRGGSLFLDNYLAEVYPAGDGRLVLLDPRRSGEAKMIWDLSRGSLAKLPDAYIAHGTGEFIMIRNGSENLVVDLSAPV